MSGDRKEAAPLESGATIVSPGVGALPSPLCPAQWPPARDGPSAPEGGGGDSALPSRGPTLLLTSSPTQPQFPHL